MGTTWYSLLVDRGTQRLRESRDYILGITGNNLASKDTLSDYLSRVREHSVTQFVVGFGISTRDDVKWFNEHADGAVVGSAIIKNLIGSENPVETTNNFIQSLKGIV